MRFLILIGSIASFLAAAEGAAANTAELITLGANGNCPGPCINGVCGIGYTCTDNMCCSGCPNGKSPVDTCVNGMCKNGLVCNTANGMCCYEADSEVHAYCAKQTGEWAWLKLVENDEYAPPVKGDWMQFTCGDSGENEIAFRVTDENLYVELLHRCQKLEYDYVQPGVTKYNKWHRFALVKRDGDEKWYHLAPGSVGVAQSKLDVGLVFPMSTVFADKCLKEAPELAT